MAIVFRRGLVIDVITDPSRTDYNREFDQFQRLVTNNKLKAFPRNTAIVKDITRGSARISGREMVCYPFFSSHLSMPLKPGEAVWFIVEDPDNAGELGFWISRICEPSHAEDANFTFFSRSYVQNPVKPSSTSSKFDEISSPSTSSDQTSQTFSYLSPTNDPQEMVSLIKYAKKIHRFHPVPRYAKRVGDLVLQGSNNALIMLGEERGQSALSSDDIIDSQNDNDVKPNSPAIDIVVGRGVSEVTSGQKIKNEIGIEEIDKRENPPYEGDANFIDDASRIYLTANSDDVSESWHPDNLLKLRMPTGSFLKGVGSFLVAKSDNIRVIGRESGTIQIVKEPSSNPTKLNGAAIILLDNGDAKFFANTINMSSYNVDPDKQLQPFVRYDALTSFLESLLNDISSFCSILETHVTPGFGAPSPQITIAAKNLSNSVKLKNELLKNGKVGNLKLGSDKIFGE